ncbi:MAG TPA: MBL fold metallo-hydrolase [Blastocatellia bacterium]|nr:MBL fold metallo-hydrolase [Blastocatellia bacterium]
MRMRGMAVGLILSFVGTSALAHNGRRVPLQVLRTQKLTDSTYVLIGRGGNVSFTITDDGVLVVDDKFDDVAQEIIAEVKKVTEKPIRFLINTHHHQDHTGGNRTFLKIATLIAHHNVRKNLVLTREQALRTLPERIAQLERQLAEAERNNSPQAAQVRTQLENARNALASARQVRIEEILPTLTFDSEVRLYLGGEEIHVFHVKRGHTDGDSIIYFTRQKVLHMGDLFVNGTFPFIDVNGGGSSREWIETLDAVLQRIDPATQIIPGHGDVGTVANLREFRQYLSDLRAAVKEAIEKGLTKEQAQASIKLDKYRWTAGFQSLQTNIATVYDEIKSGN